MKTSKHIEAAETRYSRALLLCALVVLALSATYVLTGSVAAALTAIGACSAFVGYSVAHIFNTHTEGGAK